VSLIGSLTGIAPQLITGGIVKNLNLLAFSADTYITIANPLDVGFSITSIKAAIMYQGLTSYFELAAIDYTLPSPFTIGPKGTATSGAIPITFQDPLLHLADLLVILGKSSIVVDISQNATVVVGDGFQNLLTYSQKGVTIQVEILPGTAAALSAQVNGTQSANVSSVVSAAKSDISAGVGAATSTIGSIVGDVTSALGNIQPTPTPDTTPSSDKSSSGSTTTAAATTSSSKPWPFNLF
jgi:hypothetical protein